MTAQGTSVQLQDWGADELTARSEEVVDVYAEAMEVPRPQAGGRRSILATHTGRAGLRGVAALTGDGTLVGITYGHLGEPGQWWHDQVDAAIERVSGAQEAQRWARAFEVCELHVRPAHQGDGTGRRLLDRLLEGPPAAVALLTTPDEETRARGFYRAAGWTDLVRGLLFPGDPRAFAVLGLDLTSAP